MPESNAPKAKDSEHKTPAGSALKSKTPESSAPNDKTPEGAALKRTARQAGRTAPERRYTAACAVLGAVTAAGFAACVLFRDAWGTALFFPPLGAAATALLW